MRKLTAALEKATQEKRPELALFIKDVQAKEAMFKQLKSQKNAAKKAVKMAVKQLKKQLKKKPAKQENGEKSALPKTPLTATKGHIKKNSKKAAPEIMA